MFPISSIAGPYVLLLSFSGFLSSFVGYLLALLSMFAILFTFVTFAVINLASSGFVFNFWVMFLFLYLCCVAPKQLLEGSSGINPSVPRFCYCGWPCNSSFGVLFPVSSVAHPYVLLLGFLSSFVRYLFVFLLCLLMIMYPVMFGVDSKICR